MQSELAILSVLESVPSHVYAIAQALSMPKRTAGHAVERLAEMGYLSDRWDAGKIEAGRWRPARRVYRLTAQGRRALAAAETATPASQQPPQRRRRKAQRR